VSQMDASNQVAAWYQTVVDQFGPIVAALRTSGSVRNREPIPLKAILREEK